MHNKDNIDEILKEGFEYLDNGELEKALDCYLKYEKKESENISIINNIAQIYAMLGEFKLSRKYHQKLIELCEGNESEEILMLKGNSLMSINNFSQAYYTYDKILTINPKHIPSLFQIAAILNEKEEYEKSNHYLNRILDIDEDNIIATLNKGINFIEMENYVEALKQYDRILEMSPTHELAIKLKGELLKETGDHKALKKHINQTLKVKPNSAYTLMLKAMEYANDNNENKAIEFYDRAIAIDPYFDEAYFNKASFLMLKKRYDEAIDCYKQAFEINPDSGGINDKESLFELLNQMKEAINN